MEEDDDGGSGGYCLLIDLHTFKDNDLWCNKALARNDIFYPADQTEGGKWPVKVAPVTQPKLWHDWRDSKIEIIAIDMTKEAVPASGTKRAPLKSRYAGDGVVRLYREQEAEKGESEQMVKNDDGTVVAILAIPSYFTPSDVLGFVGNKAQQQVSHFRMIKTESANRFMVLIKFRTPKGAQWFLKEYNGKLFSSMEAETCQVVLVNEIKFFASAQVVPSEGDNEIPYMLADTFTGETQSPPAVTTTSTKKTSIVADAKDHRPDPPPPASLKELPTCPVCLERMDTSVTGLMTIICQHTFHCQCLSKWGDGSCPVCRYTQRGKPDTTPATCDECHSDANPWVCLVCGHVGCGRYDSAHAYSHYVESSHCYVMEVATQRVWDYASDSYVHRLIQDPTGKLVETSGNSSASTVDQDSSGGKVGDKKQNDELALQYTHLLSSQLDSQRQYFEEMMKQAADRASEATARSDEYERDMKAMNVELVAAREAEAQAKAREKKLQQIANNSTKSLQDLTTRFSRIENDYKSEQAMSENLSAKVTALMEERTSMKEQIVELESQLKDIMFYLDTQSKLKDAGEDVQEGTVIVKNKKKGKKK